MNMEQDSITQEPVEAGVFEMHQLKKVVKKPAALKKKVVKKAMKKVVEKAMKKVVKKHVVKATAPTDKALKDAVAKLTAAQRLKLRPEGYGKCRWTPGCSPPCFTSWAALEK